jgi:hypothetical protein
MKEEITYFEKLGKVNTDETLRLAKQRAQARGIKTLVIASHTGYTAEKALEVFKGTGASLIFGASTRDRFSPAILKKVEAAGHKVIFTSETSKELPEQPNTTLRRICEGMRVVVRITTAAVDAGLLKPKERVVAVAGTGPVRFEAEGGGADTAVVMDVCGAEAFFKEDYYKQDRMRIREIICKPIFP